MAGLDEKHIFEISYVNLKIGLLKSKLDGNRDIEYSENIVIFDIKWCEEPINFEYKCLGNRI